MNVSTLFKLLVMSLKRIYGNNRLTQVYTGKKQKKIEHNKRYEKICNIFSHILTIINRKFHALSVQETRQVYKINPMMFSQEQNENSYGLLGDLKIYYKTTTLACSPLWVHIWVLIRTCTFVFKDDFNLYCASSKLL